MAVAAPALQAEWLDRLRESVEYNSILNGIAAGPGEQAVYGLSGSMKSFVTAGLIRQLGRPVLIVTTSIASAERWREDLRTWLPGCEPLLFPPLEVLPLEIVASSPEVWAARLSVLGRLARSEPSASPVVVAPIGALLRALPPAEAFLEAGRELRVGQRVDLDELLHHLVQSGYERVDPVEGRGQFSLRGGVLDVFPVAAELPLRIELFDDEIESIRRFDPHTQRSVGEVREAWIEPAREFFLAGADLDRGLAEIRRDLEATAQRLERAKLRDQAARLRARVEGHLERLAAGGSTDGLEHYLPYLHPGAAVLHDYFPSNLLVILDEPARLKEAADESARLDAERHAAWVEQGATLAGSERMLRAWADLLYASISRPAVSFSLLLRKVVGSEPRGIVSVVCKPAQSFHGQWPLLVDELGRLKAGRYRAVIFAATAERAERLRQHLRENAIPPSTATVVEGSLESGFTWPALRLAVITDGEVLGRTKTRSRPAFAARAGRDDKSAGDERRVRITHYRDLRVGDYVVHVTHGIGKYLGVKTLEVGGIHKDYLTIRYEGEDRLYVPTDQIDLVQKYIGAEGHEPRLNRLGGGEWQKVKARVKESIQKMAIELLRVQAAREAEAGHAFSPDTPWQREFEDAFKYEETPDQLQAAAEIKADMERPRPMDRLLCGDVGYGKTEVAMRAVFKAVMDSKQVAVLVPTTILAQQHYHTFRERFAGYPVRIGVLNRFRNAAEQAQTIRQLAAGEIDVIIGTHRLLSEDVRFKDLGLLVVDEEQRFGVAHKERLKQLRHNIDVLTLTATPIPRTLHMSLVGLRDMSTIETPPEDRFPVETFVAEQSDLLVREAIERELRRGGQVYYLHNRVATIERAAARLAALLPEARIAVAHGQMSEDQLEQTMMAFLEGEYDVLCCTTIIESGLDIPNVNTLIVEDADHLGLAQLYQLRGRVGRSNRLAHAYFLYRKDKVLTEVAEKRLAAIREFTEFGSGFKIALRDLEIRGAGNILGPEQHGFIVSVGFDLYCQLLEEAVAELRGQPIQREPEPTIEIQVDAYIPDSYIQDPRQKIEAYQSVMAIRSARDAMDLAEEFEDRYGRLPRPVEQLLAVARLRASCKRAGVTSVQQQRDRVTIRPGRPLEVALLQELQRRHRGRLVVGSGRTPSITLRLQPGADPVAMLEEIIVRLEPASPSPVGVLQ